jgi:hypothetical protein
MDGYRFFNSGDIDLVVWHQVCLAVILNNHSSTCDYFFKIKTTSGEKDSILRFQTAMGRRAKNKQAPPESLEPKPTWTSKKQLGKRKAEADEKPSPRPSKKVKDLNGKGKETTKMDRRSSKTKDKKQPIVVEDGSEGWEDVEHDDEDLESHAKSVPLHLIPKLLNNILLGHCSTTMTAMNWKEILMPLGLMKPSKVIPSLELTSDHHIYSF